MQVWNLDILGKLSVCLFQRYINVFCNDSNFPELTPTLYSESFHTIFALKDTFISFWRSLICVLCRFFSLFAQKVLKTKH